MGLAIDVKSRLMTWADGTHPASDLPTVDGTGLSSDPKTKIRGRLSSDFQFGKTRGDNRKRALCGNRKTLGELSQLSLLCFFFFFFFFSVFLVLFHLFCLLVY